MVRMIIRLSPAFAQTMVTALLVFTIEDHGAISVDNSVKQFNALFIFDQRCRSPLYVFALTQVVLYHYDFMRQLN